MNTELNSVILDYFEEYRQKKQQKNDLSNRLSVASQTAKNLQNDIQEINDEIATMQRIITAMIEHGCDPVEAKMRLDDLGLGNMWYNQETITLSDDVIYTTQTPLITMTDIIGTNVKR